MGVYRFLSAEQLLIKQKMIISKYLTRSNTNKMIDSKIHRIQIVIFITMLLSIGCRTHSTAFNQQNIGAVNRKATISSNEGREEVTLNSQEGDGLGILKDHHFTDGTIEIELKGEDLAGRSFVGIAFNIQNDSTYEAIYFRPFNFSSEEKIRREHSVQYISHPVYTWRKLRTDNPGSFEAEYPNAGDPNDWFAIKIIVTEEEVKVVDKVSDSILLRVNRLEVPKSDRIGLWVGNNSKGEFRALRISK